MHVEALCEACDDSDPVQWTTTWDHCFVRHILRAVRATPPMSSHVRTLATDAFYQGRRRMDAGLEGPEAFDYIVCELRRGLSRATPAAVMQPLRNLVATVGAPFATYLAEL